MNLPKAGEILSLFRTEGEAASAEDLDSALQLGEEAINHILSNRRINNHPDQALLPSETNE